MLQRLIASQASHAGLPSSANTFSFRTPTRAFTKPSNTAAPPTTPRSRSSAWTPRTSKSDGAGKYLHGVTGYARARRVRQPRHRRQDCRRPVRPREEDSLLRHLPRHADRRHRVRPSTSASSRARTPPSSRRKRLTPSSVCWKNSAKSATKAARCASARCPANSRPAPMLDGSTAHR